MQGGINNAALFNASQREARGKLEQMAGIKRPPSGILASSPELMNAVGNAAAPAMPVRATGPVTPAPVPTVQAALPQVPAPTTVAPGSVQQAAPAPQPTMMQEGGPVDVGETPVAEEASKSFMDYIRGAGDWMAEAIVATYGTGKAAEQAGRGKKAAVDAAVETGDQTNIVNTVLANADVPITDEGKQDFARNVFGMEDVNDIDEINRRIADVAISSAIGKGPDEFAQAVLLGLQNYKQTASARAAAAADAAGGGFLDTERGKAALEVYIEKIKNNEDASQVEIDMNTQMGDNIGTRVRQAITGGTGGPSGGQQTPESLLAEARDVLKRGAKRSEVEDRLREMGVDPGRL